MQFFILFFFVVGKFFEGCGCGGEMFSDKPPNDNENAVEKGEKTWRVGVVGINSLHREENVYRYRCSRVCIWKALLMFVRGKRISYSALYSSPRYSFNAHISPHRHPLTPPRVTTSFFSHFFRLESFLFHLIHPFNSPPHLFPFDSKVFRVVSSSSVSVAKEEKGKARIEGWRRWSGKTNAATSTSRRKVLTFCIIERKG